jgi:hypothetical protein
LNYAKTELISWRLVIHMHLFPLALGTGSRVTRRCTLCKADASEDSSMNSEDLAESQRLFDEMMSP